MIKLAELMGGIGKDLVEYGEGFITFVKHDIPEELSDIFIAKNEPFKLTEHEVPIVYEELTLPSGEIINIQPVQTIESQMDASLPRALRNARQERLTDAIFKYIIPSLAVGTMGITITAVVLQKLINNVPN